MLNFVQKIKVNTYSFNKDYQSLFTRFLFGSRELLLTLLGLGNFRLWLKGTKINRLNNLTLLKLV
jgi:hypothetical protein